MIVNILSSEIKERAIILTVKTVGFLARMGYNNHHQARTLNGALRREGFWLVGHPAATAFVLLFQFPYSLFLWITYALSPYLILRLLLPCSKRHESL